MTLPPEHIEVELTFAVTEVGLKFTVMPAVFPELNKAQSTDINVTVVAPLFAKAIVENVPTLVVVLKFSVANCAVAVTLAPDRV
ncbi:MAG: hypothetical protein M0D53_03670 [Flavobacterium sp. JAD_PAG50586_2]|nr:MAG: hypothetical protein M0D53_03670 [Flavobacterium sp. JAD_PAG50586_2]